MIYRQELEIIALPYEIPILWNNFPSTPVGYITIQSFKIKKKLTLIKISNFLDQALDIGLDLIFRIKTTGNVEVCKLAPKEAELAKHAKKYQPVRSRVLMRALFALKQTLRPKEYIFVDVGCGKGRSAKWSIIFKFKQYFGIDISAQLIKQAELNYHGYKNVSFCQKNITSCHFSPSNNLVFFLFNPFDSVIMKSFISTIKNNTGYILYINPICLYLFEMYHGFEVIRVLDSLNPNNKIAIIKIISPDMLK